MNPEEANASDNEGEAEATAETDDWDETVGGPQYGGEETFVHDENEAAVAQTHAIQYAPGQGRRPAGILADKNAEYLSFLKQYCGFRPNLPPRGTYGAQVKYEIMMKDSRFRKDHSAIFFKNYKLTLIKLARAINVAIRQGHHRENAPAITAQNLLQEEVIDEFVRFDKGKSFLCAKLHKSLTDSIFIKQLLDCRLPHSIFPSEQSTFLGKKDERSDGNAPSNIHQSNLLFNALSL